MITKNVSRYCEMRLVGWRWRTGWNPPSLQTLFCADGSASRHCTGEALDSKVRKLYLPERAAATLPPPSSLLPQLVHAFNSNKHCPLENNDPLVSMDCQGQTIESLPEVVTWEMGSHHSLQYFNSSLNYEMKVAKLWRMFNFILTITFLS